MQKLGSLALVAALGIPFSAGAETCAERVAWAHSHDDDKKEILTTDVKGSGNTMIEACREKDLSGEKLDVVVMLNGRPHALAEGNCIRRFAKFLVVRSTGAEGGPGQPAVAKGTTQICKDS